MRQYLATSLIGRRLSEHHAGTGFQSVGSRARSILRDRVVTKRSGSDLSANSLEPTPAMAHSEFRSAKKSFLPALLGKLRSRADTPPGWVPCRAEAAGDVFAKTCSLLRVRARRNRFCCRTRAGVLALRSTRSNGRRLSEATARRSLG